MLFPPSTNASKVELNGIRIMYASSCRYLDVMIDNELQWSAHIDFIYRVAQNKIPHQTICNVFATSGQILKILEAV